MPSKLSFQPWLISPRSVARRYSINPSPSLSPYGVQPQPRQYTVVVSGQGPPPEFPVARRPQSVPRTDEGAAIHGAGRQVSARVRAHARPDIQPYARCPAGTVHLNRRVADLVLVSKDGISSSTERLVPGGSASVRRGGNQCPASISTSPATAAGGRSTFAKSTDPRRAAPVARPNGRPGR